jgi:hypothetical protein
MCRRYGTVEPIFEGTADIARAVSDIRRHAVAWRTRLLHTYARHSHLLGSGLRWRDCTGGSKGRRLAAADTDLIEKQVSRYPHVLKR